MIWEALGLKTPMHTQFCVWASGSFNQYGGEEEEDKFVFIFLRACFPYHDIRDCVLVACLCHLCMYGLVVYLMFLCWCVCFGLPHIYGKAECKPGTWIPFFVNTQGEEYVLYRCIGRGGGCVYVLYL